MAVAGTFSFLTLQTPVEGMYKERGSKFFAFAFPVQTEAEIKKILEGLRKKYFDATHHCYAWILGADKKYFRANDDGEPNHSAGAPILGQIKSKNLTNILVVVVRYFGGTKLGVGGLTQAYKSAAEIVLANSKIIEVELEESYVLKYDYVYSPDVMKLIKEFDLSIQSQNFETVATMEVNVKLRLKEKFIDKLILLNNTGTKIEFTVK
ncbi:MAG TPA: YigZ family protein [Cytophagales bacterium]|jgi:uncharacterized YigZ family protein|nr:YigZ family protein [Cytophagales bacterium]